MHKIILLITRLMPIIFGCSLLFTAFMALIPAPDVPDVFSFWDKAQHTFAFVVLTTMGSLSFPKKLKTVCVGLLLYGASIELMQIFFTSTRVGEISDFIADSFGITIGLGIYLLVKKIDNRHLE